MRFSSFLYGKLREKDRKTYLVDRMFHLFHAKNRKNDRLSYLRDSSLYQKDGMTYLGDGLLVLFDGLGYEKDGLAGFLLSRGWFPNQSTPFFHCIILPQQISVFWKLDLLINLKNQKETTPFGIISLDMLNILKVKRWDVL